MKLLQYACCSLLLLVLPFVAAGQLYFGPSVTHASTREWNANSNEYTANDFNVMLRYQFNELLAIRGEINSTLRQGSGRTTEFVRFPFLMEFSIEDMAISNRQLWRLYFATGAYYAIPTNSTDETLIDYYTIGGMGEMGISFNFSKGAFGTVGYRTAVDLEAIAKSAGAAPQRFAASGIFLCFAVPFSIFKIEKPKEEYVN